MAKKTGEIVDQDKPLTQLQDNFARLYAIHGNASKAYSLAGYKDQGQNNRIQGWGLLQKPNVQKRVEEYRQLIEEKMDIRLERILGELASIAFSDPLDVLNFAGGTMVIKDLEQMPAYARAAIQTVEEVPDPDGGTHLKVKFHPKVPALTKLLEYKQNALPTGGQANRRVTLDMRFAQDGKTGRQGARAIVKID